MSYQFHLVYPISKSWTSAKEEGRESKKKWRESSDEATYI